MLIHEKARQAGRNRVVRCHEHGSRIGQGGPIGLVHARTPCQALHAVPTCGVSALRCDAWLQVRLRPLCPLAPPPPQHAPVQPLSHRLPATNQRHVSHRRQLYGMAQDTQPYGTSRDRNKYTAMHLARTSVPARRVRFAAWSLPDCPPAHSVNAT
jgi:hypothetical protein